MVQHLLINLCHAQNKQIQEPKSNAHFKRRRKATAEDKTCLHDKNLEETRNTSIMLQHKKGNM